MEISIPSFENAALTEAIQARWNNLTKPPGSLGQLEHLGARYALIRGEAMPRLQSKAMYVFCADHGVTAEGDEPAVPESRGDASGRVEIDVLPFGHRGITGRSSDEGRKES